MLGNTFFNAIYNILFVNQTQIIPGLWIGNYKSALDQKFIADNKINVIVNCTKDMPFPILNRSVRTIRIGVDDSLLQKDILLMESYLKKIIPVLHNMYIDEKCNILVHCHAGKQRSCIVVASLLYKLWERQSSLTDLNKMAIALNEGERGVDLSERVISHIMSRRPQAFTFGLRINFYQSFMAFVGK